MTVYRVFMSCPAGVEPYLRTEVASIVGASDRPLEETRTGVALRANWAEVMRLNLHSRLAQRVLIEVASGFYRSEQDLYQACSDIGWEAWMSNRHTFKIEMTAQHSPLTSLNFAALKVKDAVADRFRARTGSRPDVDTRFPQVRIHVHLTTERFVVYLDTSGEPLFKRGWRTDTGDAPLKETLAAAMLAACGWQPGQSLYDPCCGSGTIVIEAAQIACRIAAGIHRRFGFEQLRPFNHQEWAACKEQAQAQIVRDADPLALGIFGSDVSHRMVDFATRNAERAGVAAVVQLRGGDALQRMPPASTGMMLLNPPYGERIGVGGVASASAQGLRSAGRQAPQAEQEGDFFVQLATHWKHHFAGWSAWMLTPDLKMPGRMRLKESRRIPMWNGPIECRLFRFDLVAGSARSKDKPQPKSSND